MIFNLIITAGLYVSIIFAGPIAEDNKLSSDFSEYKDEPRTRIWNTLNGEPTTYFAHRGDTVFVPGHTLAAYELAAIERSEYVEPDLVLTKDGILVCYHDLTLKAGTDVEEHPEFEHLKKNFSGIIGIIYEDIINDYFIQDFTLAELKTLKVRQKKVGIRPQYFDTFEIPTFDEFLQVIHRMTITLNTTIGIIPELKHAVFHNRNLSQNFMENQVLGSLAINGYPLTQFVQENCSGLSNVSDPNSRQKIKCPPVIIQSFEKITLEYLHNKTDLSLMMLVDPEVTLLTYKGMEEVSKISSYYCVWKEYLYVGVEAELEYRGIEYDQEIIDNLGGFVPANEFVVEAHRLGMKMTLFTINDSREDSRMGCAVQCEPEDKRIELFYYFDMGIDGIFVESLPESRELRLIYEYETRTKLLYQKV